MFFSRPMTLSPISAKQQTSSFSPWWSGRKGSRTSPNSPSMTRSSYYEQVDTQTQTSACGKLMLTQTSDHTLIRGSFLQQPFILAFPPLTFCVVFSFRVVVEPLSSSLFKSFFFFVTSSLMEQWNQNNWTICKSQQCSLLPVLTSAGRRFNTCQDDKVKKSQNG